jgi:hypothetical protein
MKTPSREWLEKMAELGDPPACPTCGAMAGVCSDYPNCPAGLLNPGAEGDKQAAAPTSAVSRGQSTS